MSEIWEGLLALTIVAAIVFGVVYGIGLLLPEEKKRPKKFRCEWS